MSSSVAAAVAQAHTYIVHTNACRYLTGMLPNPRVEILLQQVTSLLYLVVAGFAVLVWDHMLTFNDEVQLIWPAPTTFVKLLFLQVSP